MLYGAHKDWFWSPPCHQQRLGVVKEPPSLRRRYTRHSPVWDARGGTPGNSRRRGDCQADGGAGVEGNPRLNGGPIVLWAPYISPPTGASITVNSGTISIPTHARGVCYPRSGCSVALGTGTRLPLSMRQLSHGTMRCGCADTTTAGKLFLLMPAPDLAEAACDDRGIVRHPHRG